MWPGVWAPSMTDQMPRPRLGDGLLDREEKGRWRGDVAEEEHTRAVGHAADDRLGECSGIGEGEGDVDDDDLGTRLAADIGPGLFERRIFVIGGQNLVARSQGQRLGDDVEPGGRIGETGQVLRACAQSAARATRGSRRRSTRRRPRKSTGSRSSSSWMA